MSSEAERFAIGDSYAAGRIDVVYDHDCPEGHVIRGAMGMIPCPYCAVKRAEKAEALAKDHEALLDYVRELERKLDIGIH